MLYTRMVSTTLHNITRVPQSVSHKSRCFWHTGPEAGTSHSRTKRTHQNVSHKATGRKRPVAVSLTENGSAIYALFPSTDELPYIAMDGSYSSYAELECYTDVAITCMHMVKGSSKLTLFRLHGNLRIPWPMIR